MKRRRGTRSAELLRHSFACCLAALFVVQPIAQASQVCSVGAWISGREASCCAEPSRRQEPSCCSTADIRGEASGVLLSSPVKRCACEVRAPEPLPALPREADGRGVAGGSDRNLGRWIGSGALASASTPTLEGASPSGEGRVALVDGLHPFSCAPAPNLARGARGLLAVICVARC